MRSLERATQILAVVCLVILAVMVGRPAFTNASKPARGIGDSMIALQMARSVEEVDDILSDSPSPDREVMRVKQYEDFAFIASYVALLGIAGVLLAQRARVRAALVILCAVAAGILDATENMAILRIVDLDLERTTQAMVDALHRISVLKWSVTSFGMVVLATFFLSGPRWYLRVLGAVNLVAGALVCWGLYENALLPWAAGILAAGVLLSAATLKLLTYEPASSNLIPRTLRSN